MRFGILTEKQLQKAAGGRLDNLIDLWHHDISEKYGRHVEINLGNRNDSGSPVRGGILTGASIEMKDGGIMLVIWYDPLEIYYEVLVREAGYSSKVIEEITSLLSSGRDPGPEYEPVSNPEKLDWGLVGTQIGRWLLKFRGFKKLGNENRQFFELETFLNLECRIPALYSLFDEAGFDYSSVEKKRLIEVYEGLSSMEEPSKRIDRALNALRISNIMEFSPLSEEKNMLEDLVRKNFGNIQTAKEEINGMKGQYDLTSGEGSMNFMKKFVVNYRMPGSWVSLDETIGVF